MSDRQPEERTKKRAETHACDLISRQAAIDAMADGIISEEESLVECARECNSMIEWAVEALKKLPSAQPEPDTALYCDGFADGYKQGQKDAQPEITLESAIDYLHSIGWMQEHDKVLTESAQTDIIRCKDCKHYQEDHLFKIGFCDGRQRNNDDFCSRAERRTDE